MSIKADKSAIIRINLSAAKGLAVAPDCHPERSEGSGSMGREILRCAQDDRAVLPAALWPTRAPARLRVMRIKADKSAMCTINRLPVPQTGSLRFPQE